MADPNAKIALHIEGLGSTPADIFVRGFFTTMVNLGVPFDVAGLSHPYMQAPGWTLTQYTFACWAQRMDAVFRDIAALGKKGMIAEGNYENSTVDISMNDPMPGFPVTPQGQAAWVQAVLQFASNNPNVLSFNYFYPEYYYGAVQAPVTPDLEAEGLFQNTTTVQPGMLQFNPFLNAANVPQVTAVVNLANGQPGPLAPGEYATIWGRNLAGLSAPAQQVPFLGVLADVSVSVNGQPAAVQYVSPTQINFLVPYETSPGSATVVVSAGLEDSTPFAIQVLPAAPEIFTYADGQAIAQDLPSDALNGPSAPAVPGSAITVYLVGLGAVSPAVGDGAATPASGFTTPTQTVTATIDGMNATVLFAGLTPQAVALGQVNLIVPGIAAGTYPLVIKVGNQASSAAMLSVGY